ncbi:MULTISPECIES: putative lipid II flippase FtsW [Haemophilus]|uniref:Probable peptidoglycan glycosyltransferase FtsW n=1 Tax=Haemophilus aegyptius TaxID=197575 RepID=A0ABY1VUI7_HAEAE|nr:MULTISPECIES: putative lipid II flippase FtsW [Haemophilus]EGF13058.1 cell division protein FtsW [Haemophilus aegyptius ATCC 11116]OBX82606.1 cell division protein FtsW [Haemophilus aegyptius]TMQ43311.1 cell division protein FtsW [Haemophilus influenzae biotype aegyptius]UAK83523.1 putative lipid II flippase FtsW [Haemophilus aegyptius]SQH37450.1 integral membrane protein involved in stabilizing FstZ ring during cell division [Haemophilus aegyptius]
MEFLQNIKKNYNEWTRITPQGLLYDRALFWLFVILLLIGLVAVTSASIPYSSRLFNDPFYFAKRDAIYVLLSLLTCYISLQISSSQWEKWHAKIFLFSVILLLLVPFIGTSVNGAKRWISLGILNFQPAEFAKLALTCFLASYFTRRYDEVRSRHLSIFKPLIVMLVLGCFLLLQPDLGSTVVLFIIMSGMLFIVGAKILQFVGLIALGGILFVWLVLTASYRLKRFIGFLEPFKDPYGTGFQLTNSLMAFGRGEITGKGLGNSIQKLDYLPEAHTDFIMAIIGEEFGFIGILIVILLLGLLIFRAMKIGRESLMLEQRFRGFFALGIGFWIFFQGFVNLGMALGMLPTKGLTFPLVSYGGSSIIIMSATIGILLRIDHENRLFRIGQARLRDD